jgi:hypothetical protein
MGGRALARSVPLPRARRPRRRSTVDGLRCCTVGGRRPGVPGLAGAGTVARAGHLARDRRSGAGGGRRAGARGGACAG